MLRNYLKRRNTQIDPITEQRNVGPEVEKLSLTRFSVNVTDGMTFLFENDVSTCLSIYAISPKLP